MLRPSANESQGKGEQKLWYLARGRGREIHAQREASMVELDDGLCSYEKLSTMLAPAGRTDVRVNPAIRDEYVVPDSRPLCAYEHRVAKEHKYCNASRSRSIANQNLTGSGIN